MTTIQINVYRMGDWYAARWIGGEYDGTDALEIEPTASVAEAIAAARTMPLNVPGLRVVAKVADVWNQPLDK